jgi:hypothetical protein
MIKLTTREASTELKVAIEVLKGYGLHVFRDETGNWCIRDANRN